jgi:hypothetical protein
VKFLVILFGSAIVAAPAGAQTDYRNLDHGRPTSVEDAYPVERYGFELSAGYRHIGPSGRVRHLLVPELVYGFARGAHAAVRLPFVIRSGSSAGSGGLAGADLSVLLNLTTERVALPGLAVRVDASLPVGGAGGRGSGLALTGLATRSFGPRRAHLNASLAFDTPETPGGAEHLARWWVGLAVDQTVIRQSTLLLGEAAVESERKGDPLRYFVGVGIRRQLTPTLVVDLGLGWQFEHQARTEPAVTVGLSHAFALEFLMPRGGR